jgi:hypothetical protein
MDAMLRLVAMLVVHAASLFGMRARVLSGECHADADPATLALKAGGTAQEPKRRTARRHTYASAFILRDAGFAGPQDEASTTASCLGLMLRASEGRVSKQEAGLAGLATLAESFSGLARESRFERHGNSHQSRTRTNQDPRLKAEDDVCGVGLCPMTGAIAPGIRSTARTTLRPT